MSIIQSGLWMNEPAPSCLEAAGQDDKATDSIGIVGVILFATYLLSGIYSIQEGLSWIPQVASACLALAWFIIDVLAKRRGVRIYPPFILLTCWMLWELIGTVAEGVNIDMMVGGLLSMVKTFAISFVFAQIVRGRRQLTSLYTASMIVPLLLLLMFRDDISRLMGELERGTQSDSLRIGGEALQGFGNANEVALFAVYSLIAAVGMFLMWKRSPLRWLALATAAPTLLFISYTGTRAGMITTAVLTVAFWFFYLRDIARDRPGLKVVGLLIMGLMLVGVGIWIVTSPFYYRFLQPTGNYYEGRGWLAVVGLRMFAASPIIGHGYYGFLTLAGKYGGGRLGVAHNTYVEMLIRGGLPGFLLYYSVWFVLIRQLWRLRKFPLSPGDRVAVNMSLLFCVAFNVMALSGSLINPRVVWMTVGACIGHTYALSDRIAAAEAIEGPQTEQLGEPLQARYGYS